MTQCKDFWAQISSLNKALGALGGAGLAGDPAFSELNKMRGQMLGQFMAGQSLPRINISLKSMGGFSPGVVKLWFDIEAGWFIESRETPGSPPLVRLVDDGTAISILQETISPEDVHSLMTAPSDVDN